MFLHTKDATPGHNVCLIAGEISEECEKRIVRCRRTFQRGMPDRSVELNFAFAEAEIKKKN